MRVLFLGQSKKKVWEINWDVLDFLSIKRGLYFQEGIRQVYVTNPILKLKVFFCFIHIVREHSETLISKNLVSSQTGYPAYLQCIKLSLQDKCFKSCLPGQTHGIFSHQEAVWLRSPVQGTSCRCHSPVWSPPQLWVPWRRRWADRDSCNEGKWAGLGCLGTVWKKMCTFSAT